jgi:hypothetical protein
LNSQIEKIFSDARLDSYWANRDAFESLGISGGAIADAVFQHINENKKASAQRQSGNNSKKQGSKPAVQSGSDNSVYAGVTVDNLSAVKSSDTKLDNLYTLHRMNKKCKELAEEVMNSVNLGRCKLTDNEIDGAIQDILKTMNSNKSVALGKIKTLMEKLQCH